ncbi:hypothetical protein CgunFtcFv8_021943 [Champsocephalus gunnari]|uniref:EGF-like domain-containing protein n=1 Tax=Champsocephalus gunnari TaxID=52237 RepID=A0AAN8HSU4_CHAGU|nr:hypothetical protein CgunFtcFv8_021943 [Champsocephalus gunnari]
MQLHACLLLFIITTDKTLASLHPHCGGNVRVDKEPAGHINLTLPGLITDTNQSEPPSNCTWTIDVPLGVTVLLKLVWLESGSNISVQCVLNEEDKVLKSGETALLSLCDGNKASFTWTGAGHSSNAFQLFYYVQENGRNSSEDKTSPHSDLLSWSESGTSFTSTAPIGQDVVSGTEGGRGRLYEGLEQSYGPQSASSPSSQDQGLLRPTSPLQGLTVAGRGDRETLPLPEEEPNNGADTSGAAHLADGKISARERTHPYFEQALSTDTLFHTSHTPERKLHYELPRTQMALTRSSDTLHGTDKHKYAATSKLSTSTQDHLRSRVPSFTSSPPEQHSRTTWEISTIPIPRGGASHINSLLTTTLLLPQTSLVSLTTVKADDGKREVEVQNESWQWVYSSTTTQTPTTQAPSWTAPYDSKENHVVFTPSVLTSVPNLSSTTSRTPKFYIVPDQPAAIKVESIELLLQILVEDSRSAFTSGLEEDTAAWVDPYLRKAPGFSRLLGVWSSGHAVQSVVEFETSGALQWLGMRGPSSLLERTGLSEALSEGRSFRSSKITNITLGGLQGDSATFDYCHHHGICTHHPGQLPVCRCLVGVDFWYMGQRCDLRMTRARLVGACLAILFVMVTMIGILALVAVRRYRAILIQAKVDQTRSSYRRFNHFDELSGRFWLRSWAGSADSLDNPAFTRSNELLHLRALDRPCCYHDDTLSLASTSASHGTRINTIYPHSSQYGWRGSEMSMGDGVLDSGKASDLSVCSWPVEPIQWTPFPLLQQLASHRTPTVRVSRPRSYCEGMELVDLGKSWTA